MLIPQASTTRYTITLSKEEKTPIKRHFASASQDSKIGIVHLPKKNPKKVYTAKNPRPKKRLHATSFFHVFGVTSWCVSASPQSNDAKPANAPRNPKLGAHQSWST